MTLRSGNGTIVIPFRLSFVDRKVQSEQRARSGQKPYMTGCGSETRGHFILAGAPGAWNGSSIGLAPTPLILDASVKYRRNDDDIGGLDR